MIMPLIRYVESVSSVEMGDNKSAEIIGGTDRFHLLSTGRKINGD